MGDIINKKTLSDGMILRLILRKYHDGNGDGPTFQLSLADFGGDITSSFPTPHDRPMNFTESDARSIFLSIDSKKDFQRYRRQIMKN
ncbi:MAG: hypothetical protein CMI55_00135 [Parcubacteria group bacterium]|jgi:hypothetical protein|nr:hypothetical protein [Parcubacteria group bacterium]